jgi:L-amino acid N-acyltransferase YncA
VAAIYTAGIATGNATFETEARTWEAWNTNHRADLRFVAVDGTRVMGSSRKRHWPSPAQLPD